MEKFDTISELESELLVKERNLNEFQTNFCGFRTKNIIVLKPITYFSFKSATANAGWIVQNTDDKSYSILPNVTVVKAYNDIFANNTYFGIRYCQTDAPFFMSRDLVEAQLKMQKEKHNFFNDFEEKMKSNMIMFDKNLSFFDSLDSIEFDKSLDKIVKAFRFVEIQDTKKYKDCLYLLVFDKYKQYYAGSAKNLSNRTKKHWNAIMDFGRFSWCGGEYSRINVDTFRMKDNTRIFVCENPQELLKIYLNQVTKDLEKTNTFGIYNFDEMSDLEKAERIVINNCDTNFCLSDRIPINAKQLTIGDYLQNN